MPKSDDLRIPSQTKNSLLRFGVEIDELGHPFGHLDHVFTILSSGCRGPTPLCTRCIHTIHRRIGSSARLGRLDQHISSIQTTRNCDALPANTCGNRVIFLRNPLSWTPTLMLELENTGKRSRLSLLRLPCAPAITLLSRSSLSAG